MEVFILGRKSLISKKVKVKACKDYLNGKGSQKSIGDSLGVVRTTVRGWVNAYTFHGANAFNESNRNRVYSKKFKLMVINEYNSGNLSTVDLAGKYNISIGMVNNWINDYNVGKEIKGYNPRPEAYSMKTTIKTFEEKLEMVKYVITNGYDYRSAAIKYSVNYSSIYLWVKKYKKHGKEGLKVKKRGPRKITVNLNDLSETERLKHLLKEETRKRELAEFKVEALKKKQEIEEKLYQE